MCDCQFDNRRRSVLGHLTRRTAFRLGLFGFIATARASRPGHALAQLLEGQPKQRFAFIDAHVHFQARGQGQPRHGVADYAGAAYVAELTMRATEISRSLVMPPPFGAGMPHAYDFEDFLPVVRSRRNFSFLGGGGTLNPMIHGAVATRAVDAALERRFEARAFQILATGASGFGEMSCEHLSFTERHPYEAAPPDHPLFMRLADIAAQKGVPIEIHMEAVPHDMPTPEMFRRRSPNNPPILKANIERFRVLLAANREARIVWAHLGWDNTGARTVDLCRSLLAENPNLYMNTKIASEGGWANHLVSEAGFARPEWIDLIRQFPDRIMMASDTFHTAPSVSMRREPHVEGPRRWLDQLPPDLASKVAVENAQRVYRLPQT